MTRDATSPGIGFIGRISKRQRAKGERVMGKEGLKFKFKFKELRVWQKGKDLAVCIYQIY